MIVKKKYVILNSGNFAYLEIFVDAKQIKSS